MTCTEPGCTGTIEDGYCNVCGMAPSSGAASSGSAAPPAPTPIPGSPSRPGSAAGRGSSPGSGSVSGRTSERGSSRLDVSQLVTRTTSGRVGTRRSPIGAGVVHIAPTAAVDPASVVMADPSVPERGRYCGNDECGKPVGRGKDGQKGRSSGFCSECGTRFDFAAKLHTGDLVAQQYRVAGALAHGGLGWIYLAQDRNVSDRWCVLKGLLDTADPDAAEAAVAERRFLAEVSHPAIVEIFNFVQHEGQGYIVMQYVGGPSLKQLANRRRGETGGPMPVTDAAAYLHAVLPALGYLHDHGLVYCDFKPDNVIHVADSVRLIDLGGVRRLDDPEGAVFGTVGYHAPEVAETGPTVASDLYTVGRALAVLILDWPTWQTAERERLPNREDHPVLVDHDCLWRFLQRACHPDPAQRFGDADEMADALLGVLCQVAATVDGEPRPYTSARFSPPRARLDGFDWETLPSPLLPNHPQRTNRVAGLTSGDPLTVLSLAQGTTDLSWADMATVALAYAKLRDPGRATALLDRLTVDAGGKAKASPTPTVTPGATAAAVVPAAGNGAAGADGAADLAAYTGVIQVARDYLRGQVALAGGDPARAIGHFDAAYAAAPGEPACAFAYAAALEAGGDRTRMEEASGLYRQVALTDPSWVAAVAGMSRLLQALDLPQDAARVLTGVPDAHPGRDQALTLACHIMEGSGFDDVVAQAAGDRVQAASRSGSRTADQAELAAALFGAALAIVDRGGPVGPTVAGVPPEPRRLGRAAEAALLELADATPDHGRRHELLDTAAQVRPWSVW